MFSSGVDYCIDSFVKASTKKAPPVGLEPTYHALTVRCFTNQPRRNVYKKQYSI